MPNRVYLKGTQEMAGRIQRAIATKRKDAGAALRAEIEPVVTECKKATPVDTGNLRGSEHAEGPFDDGNRIRVQIVAGGPATEYALIVHEDMTARHETGGPKYIERPLFAEAPFVLARVAKRLKT